jgi:discoidin domain receptor family protein 2
MRKHAVLQESLVVLFISARPDGAVSYSMPQGERRKDADLIDAIYDGDITPVNVSGQTTAILTGREFIPSRLSNGLGHLTDGVEGQSNFRQDPRGLGVRGYDWIGWRNETFASSNSGKCLTSIFLQKDFRFKNSHYDNLLASDGPSTQINCGGSLFFLLLSLSIFIVFTCMQ